MSENEAVRPLLFWDPNHADHLPPRNIPDQPGRIAAIIEAVGEAAIDAEWREAGSAKRSWLEAVHSRPYLASLQEVSASGGGALDVNTYLNEGSFDVAVRAAGLVCAAVDVASESESRTSFCLVRPPGHHARASQAMGFCLVNGVAVGAAYALGQGAKRVMVIDMDVHHGNGTQEIFYESPDVLFVSLHQFPWYPWDTGGLEEVGLGPGDGLNLNVPLPAMSGDAVYLHAIDAIVAPAARQFGPELLLISAGFDAHSQDPLSLMEVSTQGFGMLGTRLAALAEEVCDGRIVFVLEGGYDFESLSGSVVATLRGLNRGGNLADASNVSEGFAFSAQAVERVRSFHAKRWSLRDP